MSENYKKFCRVLLRLQSLEFDVEIRSQLPSRWKKRCFYTCLSSNCGCGYFGSR